MTSGATTRLLAIVLALCTLAAIALSVANFIQESGYQTATDGARWTEVPGGMKAYIVPSDTPAERAGIHAGDILSAINGHRAVTAAQQQRDIAASGIWSHATYTITRRVSSGYLTKPFDIQLILEPADLSDFQMMRLIALVYLSIGLYVLFRRWTAPKATHFYVFCLVSFVLYSFKYTGVLDGLDETILWFNLAAMAFQPALFLHFAVSFTDDASERRHSVLHWLLYIPAVALLTLRWLSLQLWVPTQRLQHRLNQTDYIYLAIYYGIAVAVFAIRHKREQHPLERQQLKWLTRGTLVTTLPFTAFYIVPFVLDWNSPAALTKLAVASLLLLPLTFSWAIVRYRLMDVDLIFKRGVSYTLATGSLVGLYFGVIAVLAEIVHTRLHNLGGWGLVATVILTGLLFDPLKRAIQNRLDRLFDQKRVDYRETLVEFGRDLNAQTDLAALLASIVERLPQTLLVTRVAVFLAGGEQPSGGPGHFALVASTGIPAAHPPASAGTATPQHFDLGFMDFDRRGAASHIFFENPQSALRLPDEQRLTAAALDLNYYLPCRVARPDGVGGLRTIAVIGLGRTGNGDFLSSEDVMLLESLAGYIGIAIQNAQLTSRLEDQVSEFERLKEFNENIVESINVGIFAVDLEDRIESWNAQMEAMYATPRAQAIRHPLSAVFSVDFCSEFDRVRTSQGVSTLYKFRFNTPAGEQRTANVTIAPLLNRDFQAVGRIVIVDDITDRVLLEAQLTQSEKLSSIGLLAAGVAHEVNTPLAVISSYTQMMAKQLRQSPDGGRLTPVLDKITQQTFRASEIVNGLLNFSRLGPAQFGRIDLNAMLRETVTLLEHQMRSAGVDVQTAFADSLPGIEGNRGKLQQVIVNLMLNAKDAMGDRINGVTGGRISLSTSTVGRVVRIRVSDNGGGMSPQTLSRIYDPFFTTKSVPKAGQNKGTGLGLAVTYGIVQEHGGKIAVESALGEGTTFELEFPADGVVPADAGSSMSSPAPSTEPKEVHA